MTNSAHIQIVGWNSRLCLDACLKACLAQTVRVPVLYIDNASTDGSADYVRQTFPVVRIVANADNRGYAGGHNNGLRTIADTEIAVLLNPDVVVAPDFVAELLRGFSDARVAAVAPLLLRNEELGIRNKGKGGDIVDSFGTILTPSLRAVNQYEYVSFSSLISHSSSLAAPWGFTGAAVALRRTALDDVALNGQFFDEDLFAYREDVDLSWRLQNRRWRIIGAATARGTHVRAVKKGEPKSSRVAQLSWRNYFLVLVKSVPARDLAVHTVPIVVEGLVRFLKLVVTPALWPVLPELVRLVPLFLRKRSAVFALGSRLDWEDVS